MKRKTIIAVVVCALALCGTALLLLSQHGLDKRDGYYLPPDGAIVTYFPAKDHSVGRPLVIGAATEAGFIRPFIREFQTQNPKVAVAYIDATSVAFFQRAGAACRNGERTADIYLTSSTDDLVRLANDGCAMKLPRAVAEAAPAGAQWRHEVAAFTVEPAVFVYGQRFLSTQTVPQSHIQLVDWLRDRQDIHGRVGTYDIETSADGYNFAASDSHQTALYGRLIEGMGRGGVRTFCCSNVMVDTVDRGDIVFAYNVQMSYAYAAQRAGSRIGVVLPSDYQAIQTRSIMLPRGGRDQKTAIAFAKFLTSAEGRVVARGQLMNPHLPASTASVMADKLLGQASVTPLLLSLRDQARHSRMVQEWRQAISPTDGLPQGLEK